MRALQMLAVAVLLLVAKPAPAVAPVPLALAAADLDPNVLCPGCTDLVVATKRPNGVLVRLSNGDGTGAIQLTVEGIPSAVATGDCDGDGDVDIFVAHSQGVSVLVNQDQQGGPGEFVPALGSPFPAGRHPTLVLAESVTPDNQVGPLDLDGDGLLDLAVAGRTGLTTLRGTGTCQFTTLQTGIFAHRPVGVVAGNFDGVDGVDLAVADRFHAVGGGVDLLLNDGTGHFPTVCAPSIMFPCGDSSSLCRQCDGGRKPSGIVTRNFAGHGHLDLVLSDADNTFIPHGEDAFGLVFMKGDGTNINAPSPWGTKGKTPRALVADDFVLGAGAGVPDIVVANVRSDSLGAIQGGITLDFVGTTPVGRRPIRLVAGQFNASQDANADVVSLEQGSPTLTLCLGQGDGTFTCGLL